MPSSNNKEILVLVVDDVDVSRETVTNILSMCGYKTASACDGIDAIEYYKQNGDEVDLVILDMIMPNMNGDVCFRRLKKLDPEIKVILMSGYLTDELVNGLKTEGAVGFLKKPFTYKQLTDLIEEIL